MSHAPQIIMIVLLAIALTIHLVKHGEHRTGTYSFWAQLFAVALEASILYWGGFFSNL